jgi:HD-GYP domain-containing protein (c-di-GMP phosphodiesterase class II)
MASVVDVYGAITAERVYHKGMAPTLALKKLLEWSAEGYLDKQLVNHFIPAMGIYPVGSVVELDK